MLWFTLARCVRRAEMAHHVERRVSRIDTALAKAYGVFTFCNGPSHGLEGKVCPTRSYLRARLRGHLPSRAALAADPFHGRLASHGTIALLQC